MPQNFSVPLTLNENGQDVDYTYDFSVPDGISVNDYTQTPQFQKSIEDAKTKGLLKKRDKAATVNATVNQTPKTKPQDEGFFGGIWQGVQEGAASLLHTGSNVVRMFGDVDDKLEQYTKHRPLFEGGALSPESGIDMATAARISPQVLDTRQSSMAVRGVQGALDKASEDKLTQVVQATGNKTPSTGGRLVGSMLTQAPVAIGAGMVLGPVAGQATMGFVTNYDKGLDKAILGATTGAVAGKIDQTSSGLGLFKRATTGAAANAAQTAIMQDKFDPHEIAVNAGVGGLFGALTPKMPKAPAPEGPIMGGFRKTYGENVNDNTSRFAFLNDVTARRITDLSRSRLHKEYADLPEDVAFRLKADVENPVIKGSPASYRRARKQFNSDFLARGGKNFRQKTVISVDKDSGDYYKPKLAEGQTYTPEEQAYRDTYNQEYVKFLEEYTRQNPNVSTQPAFNPRTSQPTPFSLFKQSLDKTPALRGVSRGLDAVNPNNVIRQTLDSGRPLAQAEVLAGQRRTLTDSPHPNQPLSDVTPSVSSLARASTNPNSPYEAYQVYRGGTQGLVHNRLEQMENHVKSIHDIDPTTEGFQEFMTAQRLRELSDTRNSVDPDSPYKLPEGWTEERIAKALDQQDPAIVARFEKAAEGVRKTLNDLTQMEVDEGMLSQKQADAMFDKHRYYIPLDREKFHGGEEDPVKARFSHRKPAMTTDENITYNLINPEGSTLAIKDPISAVARQIEMRTHAIERHRVIKHYTDFIDQHGGPNGVVGIGRRLGPNDLLHKGAGEVVIHKFEDGRPVRYAVPKDIGEAFQGLATPQLGVWGELFGKLSRNYVGMTVANPNYWVKNPIRDFFNVKAGSPTGYRATDFLRGLGHSITAMYEAPVKAALTGDTTTNIIQNAPADAMKRTLHTMREQQALGGSLSTQSRGLFETGKYEPPLPSIFSEPGRRAFKQKWGEADLVDKGLMTAKGAGTLAKGVLFDSWYKTGGYLAATSENANRSGYWLKMGRENDPTTGQPYTPLARAFNTLQVPTNFAMRGANPTMDAIFRMVPFIRARSLGMMTGAENFQSIMKNAPWQAAKLMSFMTLPAIAIHHWNNEKFPDVWNDIDPNTKQNYSVVIYGRERDEENRYKNVVLLPLEGVLKAANNTINYSMDNVRNHNKIQYDKMGMSILGDTLIPVDAITDGKLDTGKLGTSLMPPLIAAMIASARGVDVNTGRPLVSGPRSMYSEDFYLGNTQTGRRDTAAGFRTLSRALLPTGASTDNAVGMMFSPVGTQQIAKSIIGNTGIAMVKATDPLVGDYNVSKFGMSPDHIKTFGESTKAGARMLDIRNSLFRAYGNAGSQGETENAKSAQHQQGSWNMKIKRAADRLILDIENPQLADKPIADKIRGALNDQGFTDPHPDLTNDVLQSAVKKIESRGLNSDTADYIISSLDNRGKAAFLYRLMMTDNSPNLKETEDRMTKMNAKKLLTQGVMDELTVLLNGSKVEGGSYAGSKLTEPVK